MLPKCERCNQQSEYHIEYRLWGLDIVEMFLCFGCARSYAHSLLELISDDRNDQPVPITTTIPKIELVKVHRLYPTHLKINPAQEYLESIQTLKYIQGEKHMRPYNHEDDLEVARTSLEFGYIGWEGDAFCVEVTSGTQT